MAFNVDTLMLHFTLEVKLRKLCNWLNLIVSNSERPSTLYVTRPEMSRKQPFTFFVSRFTSEHEQVHVKWGTPEFMAPETFSQNSATSASDMWSVGVIAYIL